MTKGELIERLERLELQVDNMQHLLAQFDIPGASDVWVAPTLKPLSLDKLDEEDMPYTDVVAALWRARASCLVSSLVEQCYTIPLSERITAHGAQVAAKHGCKAHYINNALRGVKAFKGASTKPVAHAEMTRLLKTCLRWVPGVEYLNGYEAKMRGFGSTASIFTTNETFKNTFIKP